MCAFVIWIGCWSRRVLRVLTKDSEGAVMSCHAGKGAEGCNACSDGYRWPRPQPPGLGT
jgi:hypothetical protein